MSSYFTNLLTAPTGLRLLTTQGTAAGIFPVEQRVARSLPERWPAYLPRGNHWWFKTIVSR